MSGILILIELKKEELRSTQAEQTTKSDDLEKDKTMLRQLQSEMNRIEDENENNAEELSKTKKQRARPMQKSTSYAMKLSRVDVIWSGSGMMLKGEWPRTMNRCNGRMN